MAVSFLNRWYGRLAVFIIVLLPLWMWLSWRLTPKRKLVVAIIDKSVLTSKGQEHVSLNWVLNQERFAKNKTELYQHGKDYYGFFPLSDHKFRLKGLERFSGDQLEQLSNDADVAYLLYGGMSEKDLYFLKQMRAKHKLIITEFDCLGSPTPDILRSDFEKNFGVRWTGWIGRYFDSFDTAVNKELPEWLVRNYQQQHDGQWPFKKSGIAFVRTDDKVVILENETHLDTEFPYIFFNGEAKAHYGLPERIKYIYWFDIVYTDTSINHVLSKFEIAVNERGKKELSANGIPSSFPAISVHINSDYRFFYFSGDFCDNPIRLISSYFKGSGHFQWLMYNRQDPLERESFFWKVYRPLVTTVLNDYYGEKGHLGK
jgi:hypothetical protein